MMKIYGNKITNCGGGIKVSGGVNADIQDNHIYKTRIGVEVDENFSGTIANNDIQEASEHGILVNKNPYDYFEIPSFIGKDELYALFEKLDANNSEQYSEIIKESNLSKIDQVSSIAERLINFSKEYGPVLTSYFGAYLNNL